ncbi:MAG TPA: PQQ-dependent sugar dehydrogenase [Bryobacteraceae bacterium]|nr:PQQ-dependent sugar dehydrogenase [Bryobacteraceae bacterium]
MTKSTSSAVLTIATAASLFAWQAANPPLPKPYHTESATNRPKVTERPDGARLGLPEGFAVDEFSAGLQRPRIMVQAPGGEVLVTEYIPKGSVTLLADKNRDGKADEAGKKIIEGLDRPYGMAFWKDYLYVAEATSIKRYKFDPKTLAVGTGEEIIPLAEFGKGHATRTIAFDSKGEKLYLGVGSAADFELGGHEKRAAIWECNPDGTGCNVFATGLRNPTTIGFYPRSNTLWASVQERDGLGDDLVPDFFTRVQKGGFYGWPYAYFGPNEDPRAAGKAPDMVKKAIVPDVSLGAHTAVIDWKFYTGKAFPAKYRDGAFLALHGSGNRSKRVGYSVVFVPFKSGKPSGNPEDFLTGWMLDPSKTEVWGRPTGVLVLNDGSLLVSDDGGNRIWRISHKS